MPTINPLREFISKYKIGEIFQKYAHLSLIKNAGYLFGSEIVNSMFGFLFWMIAGKLYSPEDIGKAGIVLSAASLITLFAEFGLGDGLVRLLPESIRQEKLASSVLIFTSLASFFVVGLFFLFPSVGSEDLLFLTDENWILVLYLGFCILSAVFIQLRMIYLAKKKTIYILYHSLLNNIIRVAVIILGTNLGFAGLISANFLGVIAAVGVGLFLFAPKTFGTNIRFEFSIAEIVQIFPYSFGNYLSNLVGQVPRRIVPLLAFLILGTVSAGFGQVTWVIGSFITVPGLAISSSALSEASNDPGNAIIYFSRALKYGVIITVLMSVVLGLIAPWILRFLGAGYVEEGTGLLRWLAAASLLIFVDWLYFAYLRFKKRLGYLLFLNLGLSITIIASAYYFMPKYELSGYGIGWGLGHLIILLFIVFDVEFAEFFTSAIHKKVFLSI